jgi:hypothetical protein
MLDTEYERALRVATESENRYLEAVRRGEERELLTDLAMEARDAWIAAATMCALGEDGARSRIADLPSLPHDEALNDAWLNRRNWAACGEDAAGRADLIGALIDAHRGAALPSRRTARPLASQTRT